MRLPKDLREFIELLNSTGVEYIVVGAHATAFHGRPRYTGDIDFLIRPKAENAARVLSVLRELGFSAFESGVAGDLDGLPVFFIGKDAHIRNKRATGRLQDAADAEAIE